MAGIGARSFIKNAAITLVPSNGLGQRALQSASLHCGAYAFFVQEVI